MGAMLPVLGVAMGAQVLGAILNGMADRQAMRAMMGEKKRQMMLWQRKRALDQRAQSEDITRALRERGGMRDVEVRGDQAARNIANNNQSVMSAIAGMGLPGMQNQQDMTASILPGMLAESRDQQFQAHGDMEQRNQGGYRLGSKIRDANFQLDETLNPIREQLASMKGGGLRFIGQLLSMGGGVGGAIAPWLSGPSMTPGKYNPSEAERFKPSPFEPAESYTY